MQIERHIARNLLLGVSAWCVGVLAMASDDGEQPQVPAATTAAPSTVQQAEVLARIHKLYPGTKFTSVTATPIHGLYEVVMGQTVAYVGTEGTHFVFGHLFDMQRQQDLTAERKALLGGDGLSGRPAAQAAPADHIDLAELPLQDAIKQVRGNGARTLVVFSDPLCPYCRKLDDELARLDNATVYTFLIPILGERSRQAAQEQWKAAVPARGDDTEVFNRNLTLAGRYGITGTPTLIREDGVLAAGALSLDQLNTWMNAASKVQKASAGNRTP